MEPFLLYTIIPIIAAFTIAWPFILRLIRKYKNDCSRQENIVGLLLKYNTDPVAITDKEGFLKASSESFDNLVARSIVSHEPISSFVDLVAPAGQHDYRSILKYIHRENKPTLDFNISIGKFDTVREMNLTVVPLIDSGGSISDLIHILSQSGGQGQTEKDMGRIERLTNIGQITAGIAHELNTPLGSIILSADIIKEMKTSDPISEEAEYIIGRAEHCSKVVKELLGYVRDEDNVQRKHDLTLIVEKVKGLVEGESAKRNIVIGISSTSNKLFVVCHESQMEQLFFNFFSNSFHAIGHDGRIEVRIGRDNLLNQITVVVSDDGRGIACEHIDRVFDPFFTTKPGTEGTGLGLALCKKIILAHGGTISVNSTVGEGTIFTINLPVAT